VINLCKKIEIFQDDLLLSCIEFILGIPSAIVRVIFNKVLNFARAQIGEKYVFGAAGMTYWDCSGLTMTTYQKAAGIYISWHSVVAQFRLAAQRKQLVPMRERQAGDLIFYTTSSAFDGDKYHIAIYSGNNKMIEAPRPGAFVREVPMRWGELFPYAARPSA
jgi:cell wall-associated NlpC family hydrolase